MAIALGTQTTDNNSSTNDLQDGYTPSTLNGTSWMVAVVVYNVTIQDAAPIINLADTPRNPWTLLSTRTVRADYANQYLFGSTYGVMGVQVWAAPGITADGWGYIRLCTAIQSIPGTDKASVVINMFEVTGMGNQYLTVDSIVVGEADVAGSVSVTLPTPAGGATCLQLAAAVGNSAYGSYSTTGTGFTQLTNATRTGPDTGLFGAWREGSTSQTVTFSLVSPATATWAAVGVNILKTGVAPATNTNPNWPAMQLQIGYGYNLSTPPAYVYWTDQSTRFWALNTKRGIQYELGNAQAEPTTVTLRNDDGAMIPKASVTMTATANGTTTTFVCAATDAANLAVGDVFKITNTALNANPNFDTNVTGWTATGCTFTRVTTPVHAGAGAGQIVPNGAATVQVGPTTRPSVTPGVVYEFSAWIYAVISYPVELRAQWYDGTSTLIFTDSVPLVMQPGVWTQFYGYFTAPATAATVGVLPTMINTPNSTTVLYVDQVQVNRKSEFTAYQVTKIATAGATSTVTFQIPTVGGGALNATSTGDVLTTTPLDIYTPYRVMATWNGKQQYVNQGWAERWPATWRDPHWGTVAMVGTSALAQLTAAAYSALQGEILRRNPTHYWPCSDAAGSVSATNISGRSLTQLFPTTSKVGTGTATADFGVSTQGANMDPQGLSAQSDIDTLFGDPGNIWQQSFDGSGATPAGVAQINAGDGWALVAQDTGFPSIANGVTVFFVLGVTQTTQTILGNAGITVNPTLFIARNTDPGTNAQGSVIKIDWDSATREAAVTTWDKTTHASTRIIYGALNFNIQFEYLALSFTTTSYTVYLDGNNLGSHSCNLASSFQIVDFMGEADQFFSGHCMPGMGGHFTIFDRVLSDDEILRFQTAGKYGYNGSAGVVEDSSVRIQRKLDEIGMKTARVLDNTNSLLCDADGNENATTADLCNSVAGYDDSLIFEDAAGVYQHRAPSSYAYQVNRATLGERPDLGEIPYLPGPEIDYDPTYLYNSITAVNTIANQIAFFSGIAQTQITATDDTSVTKYNLRTYIRNTRINSNHPEYVFDLVYWLLGNYGSPSLRVQTVTLNPAANPSIWYFCLTVEVGDLLAFKRRPIGAPEIDINVIVLQVMHDTGPGKWQTTLTLGTARAPQLIFGNGTLGIVGTNFMGP